ncbi:C39 family peptidase [Sciscionella marina]|uniref:C39 family peptidase n=1 Tax=Sciscionella marina TaxID=508770 RepID=UPI0003A299A3|nr:C39 family peptidase [Sciscionella marina]
MRARRILLTLLGAVLLATSTTTGQALAQQRTVDYHQWASARGFAQGHADGVRAEGGGIAFAKPTGSRDYEGHRYESANWTSPRYSPGVSADQIVTSWNAHTPKGTWLEVGLRVTGTDGRSSGWYSMGRWASGDTDIKRTSVKDQSDPVGSVDTDTFSTADGVRVGSYQLRVSLYRAADTTAKPSVSLLGAMASAVPPRFEVPPSKPGVARGVELKVPRYSQDVHKGDFPQYDGGGEAWCSPTSTEMVVEYWGHRPSPAEMRWIPRPHPDPSVDYAARYTYDTAYQGTGNWSFNAAYAGRYGLSAHVTRLRSLDELERYVRAGVPVITSQSFLESELPGAGYGTAGHLMVVIGFTENGDVIANDPASPNDKAVRHVYPRHAFENIWLRTKRHDADGKLASGSGGTAYLYTPKGWSIP